MSTHETTITKLKGEDTYLMMTLDAATGICANLRLAKESGATPLAMLKLIEGLEKAMARVTSGDHPYT